ncbi:hypothetical protein MN116_000877 [Schistosoma mekongi]|uniref:Helicase C-terminal domain-containing protein n=1 Tax=Schistosoma mekongi TaxID=38744 RepID=A0AAE2D930_SCHME|nr:hypothetical protein MN116_000877 [Schistosoma mekongi]
MPLENYCIVLFPVLGGRRLFLMTVKNTWLGFVHLLKERDLLPVIAFSFSRSSLETLAKSLSSVDLTSTNEKQLINKFFSLTTSCLRKCDRKLASVRFIRDLTKRGLAVHHAGMLPVLKETVELLFRMGLVKILFATETFSTGVNMPARCVVFTSIDKFDGQMIRPLSSSEYTQMAGRAGRRGLDAKGYVIILVSSIGRSLKSSVTGLPTENVLRSVILGTQTRLVSQFKVTYSMILNLHRSSSLTPRDVMKRSFMEAASHRWETEQRQRLSFLNKKLDETTTPISSNKSSNDFNQTSAINSVSAFAENSDDLFESLFVYLDVRVNCPYNGIECCDSISAYYQLCYRYRQLTQSLICTLSTKYERYLQNIFCPGRVILLQVTMKQSVWLVPGVIINYYWKTKKKDGKDQLLFHAILWKLPTNLLDSSTFVNKKQEEESETLAIVGSNNKISTAPVDEDKHSWFNCEYDEIEEKILRNIEDSCDTQWTETPVPPHLVPVFMPSSLEDGYARLTLQSILPDDSLFRICDRIVTFENKSNLNDDGSLKSNMNISDRLFHSIKQHQTVVTLRKTSSNLLDDNNEHYFSILNDVNLALFNSVNPPQHNSSFHVIYKTLSDNVPKQVDIIKELKADKIDEEDVRLFDEYSTISDQLTNPLSISDTTTLTSNLLKCPNLLQHLNRFHQTIRRKLTIKRIESNLADYQLQLSKEYTGRLNVLKELGFIDSATQSYCLSFKGFFACELTKKEVVLTQLLLDGFIDNLLAPEIAAVLSVFANEIRTYDFSAEKKSSIYLKELVNSIDCINSTTNYVCNNDLDLIPRHLLPVFKRILICAYKLETLQRFHNLSDPYLECRFDLRLVPLVYKWAKGYSFSATIAKCDLPEGLLVKSLLQLDELIRHIIGACRQFGKHVLGLKMCEAKNLIYRDIVCSPSLYVLKGIKSAKDD